jgi:hypothetical protein
LIDDTVTGFFGNIELFSRAFENHPDLDKFDFNHFNK